MIIALIGNKGSGKSTTLEIIKKNFPNVQEGQLAKRLKDVCALAFNVPRDHFDDQQYKEKEFQLDAFYKDVNGGPVLRPILIDINSLQFIYRMFSLPMGLEDFQRHVGVKLKSPRHIAQYVGTEIIRAKNEHAHLKELARTMGANANSHWVVSDCRFMNEYEFLRNMFENSGFVALYIDNKKAEETARKDNHPSEQGIKDIAPLCLRIDNNGTLEQLEANVITALNEVLNGQRQLESSII